MQSLLFFLLLVASVWAESTRLVFFRKVDNHFIPLTVAPGPGFTILSTNPSNEHTPEFSSHQGYVETKGVRNSGDVGFYGPTLAFGPTVTATRFELDGRGMIIKPKLYYCHDPKRNSFHSYTSYPIDAELCDKGEVYLLPRDAGNNNH